MPERGDAPACTKYENRLRPRVPAGEGPVVTEGWRRCFAYCNFGARGLNPLQTTLMCDRVLYAVEQPCCCDLLRVSPRSPRFPESVASRGPVSGDGEWQVWPWNFHQVEFVVIFTNAVFPPGSSCSFSFHQVRCVAIFAETMFPPRYFFFCFSPRHFWFLG